DGVALAGPVALECLQGWYGENTPMRRRWTVAGERIDPRTLELPTLLVVPRADRIVPPGSAMGLAQELADVQILRPPLGHIGMVASARAKDRVWERLAAWLDQHSF
ncbi:MAG: alpha/beta hydrolase, partial [Alphaproteobacteria bacterium]|nr:alpha/beta hydrolase [Alphaproteobacteria bacterium]